MAKKESKRARSEWKVQNVQVELKPEFLLVPNVPVKKNAVKDEQTGVVITPESLWHVNIQFRDFEDIIMRACEKVLHTVGHEIDKGHINPDGDERGITTVLSTGKPPKAIEDTIIETKAVLGSAKTEQEKKANAAALIEMMKAAGYDSKMLAQLVKG